MSTSSVPVLPQTPKITPVTIVNADGTTVKTVFTAGANGSKIVGLSATNTDAAGYTLQVWLTRSATNYLLGSLSLPANAGFNGSAASTNLFASGWVPGLPIDNDGQPYLFLESGDTLTVGVTVAVTAAKTVTVVAVGANF